jgi:putative mRNA 3-end processing factor
LVSDSAGLFCPRGGFWIDPWRPVPLAFVTHAHGDHARPGSRVYVAAEPGLGLLRRRVNRPPEVPSAGSLPAQTIGWIEPEIRGSPYGVRTRINGVTVSFHPAGHVLGSAQIRVESADTGEVWVVSGDYKRQADPTCGPFEPVPCDVFITEATFALPIYRWDPPAAVIGEIARWWDTNRAEGRASVLFCYALGKAQRILAEVQAHTDRAVFVHGAVEPLTEEYRRAGIAMLPTRAVADEMKGRSFAGELVLAPPSAAGTPWMRRFGAHRAYDTGFASGWMRVRGIRRRRGYDRGFELSDHADWPDLLRTVRETGAKQVYATHGYSLELARYLSEQGIQAQPLQTAFGDEDEG